MLKKILCYFLFIYFTILGRADGRSRVVIIIGWKDAKYELKNRKEKRVGKLAIHFFFVSLYLLFMLKMAFHTCSAPGALLLLFDSSKMLGILPSSYKWRQNGVGILHLH